MANMRVLLVSIGDRGWIQAIKDHLAAACIYAMTLHAKQYKDMMCTYSLFDFKDRTTP
jgi:hypothetical protein